MAFGWYDPLWTKVKKMTVPAAKVGGTGTVEDMRILVSVTDAEVQAAAQADGDDILFCDSDGVTKLAHDLVSYNGGTGAILAWVLVPELDGAVDNTLWMYYGNGAAAAQENKAGTWKDATVLPATGIYHFENDVVDVSGNANNGTNDGTVDVAGKVGRGRTFDGTNDSISAAGAGFTTVEQLTSNAVGAYIKAGASAVRQQIFYKGNTGKETLDLFLDDGGSLVFMCYLAGTYEYYAIGATDLRDSAWHRVWGIRDGSTFRVVVDGVDDTSLTVEGALSHSTTEDVYMGKRFNEDYFLNADVDEIFVLGGAPSVAWCLTEFNSLDDPATFVTFGAESTFVESTGQEMNFFPMEEIVADREMPWWYDPLRVDREMLFPPMEHIIADREMALSIRQHPDVDASREMPFFPLEEIIADREMPETILEEIIADVEPPVAPIQEIIADRGMVFGLSQDRADDREMNVTILEELVPEEEMPLPVMEEIISDLTMPFSAVQEIVADRGFAMFIRESLESDREMPVTISEELVTDREMVFRNLEGILSDEDMPVSIVKEIVVDRVMGFTADEIAVTADRAMRVSFAEAIESVAELPMSWSEPVTVDVEMPATVLEEIEVDTVMGLSLSEYLETDREPVVRVLEGILNDLILPGSVLGTVEADREMPATVLKELFTDREMVLFMNKVYPLIPVSADREMPLFMGQGVSADVEMPATLSEWIEAMREMPMEWWDEVKHRIPDGEYQLLVQTYQYQLEAMTEETATSRTATKLVGKT